MDSYNLINQMQLYIISFALREIANDNIKEQIRKHYKDMNYMYNAKGYFEEELRYRLNSDTLEQCVRLGVEKAWMLAGEIAGIPSSYITDVIKDPTIVQCCFAAQVAWLYAGTQKEKDAISEIFQLAKWDNIPSNDTLLNNFVMSAANMLREYNTYRVNGYQGFHELIHTIHVVDHDMYVDYAKRGFGLFNEVFT